MEPFILAEVFQQTNFKPLDSADYLNLYQEIEKKILNNLERKKECGHSEKGFVEDPNNRCYFRNGKTYIHINCNERLRSSVIKVSEELKKSGYNIEYEIMVYIDRLNTTSKLVNNVTHNDEIISLLISC